MRERTYGFELVCDNDLAHRPLVRDGGTISPLAEKAINAPR